MAGDDSKMYFVDSKTESGTKSYVTLELSASRDAANRVATIRPVFVLPSALEPGWISLSANRDWLAFLRKSDNTLAYMQLDLNKADYTTAIGSKNGFLLKVIGAQSYLAKDFDDRTGTLT